MSVLQRRSMMPEEFLAWEARQAQKWDFDGLWPVAMAGGSNAHAAIQGNLITALTIRLRGKPSRARGSDLKIKIGSSYRYPDAFVFCTPVALDATVVTEPVVISEVLSPSTSSDDRTVKMAEYRSLASVQRYIVLEQERAFASVVSRTATGWEHAVAGADGIILLSEIGIELPVAELYEGLDFALPDAED